MKDESSASTPQDQRANAVIAAYLESVAAGQAPDRQQILALHPDLADELASFFADHDAVEQLAQPFRPEPARTSGEAVVSRTEALTLPPAEAQASDAMTMPHVLQEAPTPALDAPALPPGPPLGSKLRYVGDYELREELGRGGMGVVYLADQVKLKRLVALKMILAGGHAGAQEVARFRSEAEAVARLQHPNIVQIYEVSEHEGHPYFSLEYVAGGSLAGKLDGTPWPPRQAAALVETLARAMQAAHREGVVHRDLKPANVLLTAEGQPKITDFGLAKQLGAEKGQTQSGAIMGTPSYMAPEQAGGKSKEIGPACDIYALGSILYELLTGRPPFKAATPLDTVLQVVTDEPVPPRSLQSKTPRDLETICLKCLEKSAPMRYASAAEMAEDLRRYQAGEPIRARPVGGVERLLRWSLRNPAVAGLGTAVALLLVVGTAVAWYFAVRAEHSAGLASDRADDATRAQKQAEAETRRVEWLLYAGQIAQAKREWETKDIREAWEQLTATREHFRDWEYQYLHALFRGRQTVLRAKTWFVAGVAFSPDGKQVLALEEDGTLDAWDAAGTSNRRSVKLQGFVGDTVWAAISADSRRVAVWKNEGVQVWDATTGRSLAKLDCVLPDGPRVAFSSDGRRLLTVARKEVKVWDADSGRLVITLTSNRPQLADTRVGAAFSPDGKQVAAADGATILVWNVETGRKVHALLGEPKIVTVTAFSPDGKRLAAAHEYGTGIKVWDLTTGRELLTLRGHVGSVDALAFSPDGTRLASGGWDRTIRLWNSTTGQEEFTLKGADDLFDSLAFSPDGKRIAATCAGPRVQVWDVIPHPVELTIAAHAREVKDVTFSPDGKWLASGSWDQTVRVWDPETGRELFPAKTLAGSVQRIAFGADSRQLGCVGGFSGAVWDIRTGRSMYSLGGHAQDAVAISTVGDRIATGGRDGQVKTWDAATGRPLLLLAGHTHAVSRLTFSPDGQLLASASADQTARIWDVTTGRELLVLSGHDQAVQTVAFSPDGKLVLTGGDDGTAKVWEANTGQLLRTLTGHRAPVQGVAFSPNGRRIATGGDTTVRLWDVTSGQMTLMLKGRAATVSGVAFSPNGRWLASSCEDGTLQVYDAGQRTEEHIQNEPAPAASPAGHSTRMDSGWPPPAMMARSESGRSPKVGDPHP